MNSNVREIQIEEKQRGKKPLPFKPKYSCLSSQNIIARLQQPKSILFIYYFISLGHKSLESMQATGLMSQPPSLNNIVTWGRATQGYRTRNRRYVSWASKHPICTHSPSPPSHSVQLMEKDSLLAKSGNIFYSISLRVFAALQGWWHREQARLDSMTWLSLKPEPVLRRVRQNVIRRAGRPSVWPQERQEMGHCWAPQSVETGVEGNKTFWSLGCTSSPFIGLRSLIIAHEYTWGWKL